MMTILIAFNEYELICNHTPNKDGYSLEIFYNFVREIISIS